MPNMSGVEFLKEVWQRHPETVRMILTGFADIDAIIESINDGHVYAYITKPWEPDHLKQVMKQAVKHYELTVENERLVKDLKHANVYLEAVMDQLDTGALAVDADGVIQAANRPVRDYLALEGDLRGEPLKRVLEKHDLRDLAGAVYRLAEDDSMTFDEVDVTLAERAHRLRVAVHNLADPSGETFGRVVLLREISHEPLRRRFEDIVDVILRAKEGARAVLEQARDDLRALAEKANSLHIDSSGLGELGERISRTGTAIDNWLVVDDALVRESYPDAQLLQDRMRVAMTRWPADEVPEPVRSLARRVEEYYESGENTGQAVL
jgi:CheY-like chemotaxis protein